MSSTMIPKSPAKPTIKSKYERSNKKYFINSLSAIPMFDLQSRQSSDALQDPYQTSYRQQYQDSPRRALADDMGGSFSEQLISRSLNFNLNNQGLSYADKYRLNKLNSESLTADSGFFSSHYKRPTIPAHIKRDDYYQSNSERNIGFLHTVYGIIPYVPSKVKPSNKLIIKIFLINNKDWLIKQKIINI